MPFIADHVIRRSGLPDIPVEQSNLPPLRNDKPMLWSLWTRGEDRSYPAEWTYEPDSRHGLHGQLFFLGKPVEGELLHIHLGRG